jgi:hypothetical protein
MQGRALDHRHMGLSPGHRKLAPKRAHCHCVKTRLIVPAGGRYRDPNRYLVDLGKSVFGG